MKGGWVYIMTNAPHGTLYVGVTADLPARIVSAPRWRRLQLLPPLRLTRLVYCEPYERIEDAIAREKAMKAWRRQWKIRLIEQANPGWDDLFDHIIQASF